MKTARGAAPIREGEPYNLDAERALAGAALMEPALFANTIDPADFWLEVIGEFWMAGHALWSQGVIPDEIRIRDVMTERGVALPFSDTAEWVRLCPSPVYAESYAEIVKRMAQQRRLYDLGLELAQQAQRGEEPAGLYDAFLGRLGELRSKATAHKERMQWSAAELLQMEHVRPPAIVEELLYPGLAILGGPPKRGKSHLVLQLVQAVSTGGTFLGRQVAQGGCLYMALEDPAWRVAERMRAQGWTDASAKADFWTVGSLRAGGGEEVAQAIRQQAYRLVVVDTLSRALTGDQNKGQEMTAALTPVQEAAHAMQCAVLLIDHFNKLGTATAGVDDDGEMEGDPILNLAGSISKSGMADTVLGLYRQRGKRRSVLAVTGRDVEEQAIPIQFDWATRCWQPASEQERTLSTARAEILQAVEDLSGEASYTEVVKAVGKDRGNVYKQLQDLVNMGYLTYSGKRYSLAPERDD